MRHKILIIDDSEDIHPLIGAGLGNEELDFESAFDGNSGIERALRTAPDLILLDVDMPLTDGFEVCRRLKADARTESIPVIFLTGASSTLEKLQGLAVGAIDYVTKPFDAAELRARVRSAIQVHDLLALLADRNTILQKSEEGFRVLAENCLDIITRLSSDGTCIYASPACRSILGYESSEWNGHKLYDFVHPEDVSAASNALTLGPAANTWSSRFRRRDGSYVWLETTARKVFDQSTQLVREIHASSRDITLRKRAEVLEEDRAAVLEAIAQNQEIEVVLGKLVHMVEQQFSPAVASVTVVTDARTLQVAPNLTKEEARAVKAHVLRKLPELSGEPSAAAVICVSDLSDDDAQDRRRDTATAASTLRSCWSLAIRTPLGGVLGLFMVCHRHLTEPDAAARGLLDLTGKLLAIALEHRHIANQLAYRAHHDALTGLPNRVLFEDRLAQMIARSDRTNEPSALLYVDVDRFKLVNDTLGHQAGDELLCQLVQRLQGNLRKTDTLARLGGDEFALVIPDLKDCAGGEVVAAKLIASLQSPFDVAGREIFVTVSIGTAVYPKDAQDALSLQKSADAAMYRAKASGRNQARSYAPEMATPDAERLELINGLRRALDNDELLLHYQPLVDHASRIIGFEALVRWNHPALGLLLPARFITLAEETGLILPLGIRVLHEALRQNKQWQLANLPPVRMSVNVSAVQFAQPNFVETVRAALEKAQLEPKWLELELTETILMQNFADGTQKLDELTALGVSVAIDDFGTGYSSLAYLQRLSVDTLKIDRTFVHGIPVGGGGVDQRNETAVIRAVTLLAQSLGLRTVAEGVENELQRAVLIGIGCDLLQGYMFGKPCAPAEARAILEAGILPGTSRASLTA